MSKIVGRIDQYGSVIATYEFDETTSNNPSITGLGTYYSDEFSENVGIGTTLFANVFPPYDIVYDEFAGVSYGPGQGSLMRHNSDKCVFVYNEIDEITDLNRDIVTNGLLVDLDAGNPKSYLGLGTAWTDLSGNNKNGTLINGPTFDSSNEGSIVFDGTDDYVSGDSTVSIGSSFTISVWLKHNTLPDKKQKYIILGNERAFLQHDGSDTQNQLNFYFDNSTEQNLWAWGNGNNGSLGNADTANRSTPITTFIGGTNWKEVSIGYQSAAIKTDGTLWMWGNGSFGKLGNADTTNRSTPITTFTGGTNWKQVSSSGGVHVAAIKTDGTLWTWGRGSYGRLGNADTTNRSTPVTTFLGGTNWKQVSAGGFHIAAIKTDGTLWLWGDVSRGQLGNAVTTGIISTPITTFLGGTNWKQVSTGSYQTAVIKTDGTLWTWGYGGFGSLGNAVTTGNASTPITTFIGGTNWKQVSNGTINVAAIKTDGTLWTWGSASSGRLGNAVINGNLSTPVTTFLGGTNWKQVSATNITAAIKTDGTLWTWGLNTSGQLGNNTISNRSTPITTFLGGTGWKQVSTGLNNATASIKSNATFISDLRVNSALATNTFYNIVGTWDGTTTTLYRNGSSIGTDTPLGTLTSTNLSYTISSLLEPFDGNIYAIAIYNRALSTSEILYNFNSLKSRYGL